jgi:hypothetical protein
VPWRDQHRDSGRSKGLLREIRRVTGDVILFKQITTTGDQVHPRLLGALNDALQSIPQILSVLLRPSTIEALAGKGPVEMQVSEMEQAKGH